MELLHALRAHGDQELGVQHSTAPVWACAFGSEHMVASVGGEIVCVLDVQIARVTLKYVHEGEDFWALAWACNGYLLAAAGKLGSIKLIDIVQQTCYEQLYGHTCPINALASLPSHQDLLLSGDQEGWCIVWAIQRAVASKASQQASKLLMRHKAVSSIQDIGVAPDGAHVILASSQGVFEVLAVSDHEIQKITLHLVKKVATGGTIVDSIAFLSNNMFCAKASHCAVIGVYSITGSTVNRIGALQWSSKPEYFIKMAINRGLIAVGDSEGQIHLFNVHDKFRDDAMVEPTEVLGAIDPSAPSIARQVAISASGNRAVVCYEANILTIWDVLS